MPKSDKKKHESNGKAKAEKRKVYPQLQIKLCSGKDALTATDMMELLGWEPEEEKGEYGEDFLLVDEHDRKIRCTKNLNNRWYDHQRALRYAYAVLNKQWAGPSANPEWTVNGDPCTFDWHGNCRSAQHRGIGLILAKQIWEKDMETWGKFWKTEPVMDTVLVLGISPAKEVIRTLDTGRERTGADSMFASGFFPEEESVDRRNLCKLLEQAVNFLWIRTEASEGDNPYKTQPEVSDFVERHPGLMNAVKFVYSQDNDGVLSHYIGRRYIPGLMYLMAACDSNREKYEEDRREKSLVMKWTKVEQFWKELGLATKSQNAKLREVYRMSYPREKDKSGAVKDWTGNIFSDEEGTSLAFQLAAITHAWNVFNEGGAITEKNLALKFDIKLNSDGTVEELLELLDDSRFGGIEVPVEVEEPVVENEEEKTKAMMVQELRSMIPGRFLIMHNRKKNTYAVRGKDVEVLREVCGIEPAATEKGQLQYSVIDAKDIVKVIVKLWKAGHKPSIAEPIPDSEDTKFTHYGSDGKPLPSKPEKGKSPSKVK